MNIFEAAKTGKPFRRPGDTETYGPHFWVDLTVGKNKTVALGQDDLVAEDWEIQTEHDVRSGAV